MKMPIVLLLIYFVINNICIEAASLKVEEANANTSLIYTTLMNYIKDTKSKSDVKIHSMYVIMPNATDKQYDQTYILSKNDVDSISDILQTLDVNKNLKLKVTQLIDVAKMTDKTQTPNFPRIGNTLQKHLSVTNNIKKLRSILIRRRKASTPTQENTEVNTLTQKKNINLEHIKRHRESILDQQENNLIITSIKDNIAPAASTVQESFAKPEQKPPTNHAIVYKPPLIQTTHSLSQNINLDTAHINPYYSNQRVFNMPTNIDNRNDFKVILNTNKLTYNVPQGQFENAMKLDTVDSLMNFVSNIYGPNRHLTNPVAQHQSLRMQPREALLIVGQLPKPLPTHFTNDPYKNQLQLPKM